MRCQIWLAEAAGIAAQLLLLLITQSAEHLLYVAFQMKAGLGWGLLKGVSAARHSCSSRASNTQILDATQTYIVLVKRPTPLQDALFQRLANPNFQHLTNSASSDASAQDPHCPGNPSHAE